MRIPALFVGLLAVIGLGCASLTDIGQDACDSVFGGSSFGQLCGELDILRPGDTPEATEVPEAPPAE